MGRDVGPSVRLHFFLGRTTGLAGGFRGEGCCGGRSGGWCLLNVPSLGACRCSVGFGGKTGLIGFLSSAMRLRSAKLNVYRG